MGFFSNDVPSLSDQQNKLYSSMESWYPQMMQMLNSQAMPSAMNQLAVQQATSAPTNQLQLDLARQFSPQYAQLGLDLGKQMQQGQAGNNAAVANSSEGQAALNAAIAADMKANPEFYATRSANSGALGTLLTQNQADLNNPISAGVSRSIDQNLARANGQTGNANSPSQLQTVANAMQYGQAGYNMHEQAKSDLSNSIAQATNFLPASKSGIDSWGIATGGPNTSTATAASSLGMFPGINTASSNNTTGANLLGGMIGQGTSMSNSLTNAAAQQSTGFGNLLSGLSAVGGVMGAGGNKSAAASIFG